MNPRQAIIPGYLVFSLLLGGASAAGYMANMLLQLVAVALLLFAFGTPRGSPFPPPARQLMTLLVLLLAIFVIQLVPLPPALWTALPGRHDIAEGYRLLGVQPPWMPISLAPDDTIFSLFWLLPAFAAMLGILRLGDYRASWIAWAVVGVAILSIVLGGLQVAAGGIWYLYRITNRGVAVGFFANANHLATLLLMVIPLLAALLSIEWQKGERRRSSGLTMIIASLFVVLLVGLALNRSLAGWGLAVPVAMASAALLFAGRKLPRWVPIAAALIGIAAIAAVFTTPFGNNLTGDDARGSSLSRYTSFTRTSAKAVDYLPFGSGVSTFVEVYRDGEDTNSTTRFFMNHAHSDFLEVALETGLPGIALLLLFLFWWARRTFAIWRNPDADPFARAATIASAAVIAHSLVDYPLRTAAISALFAAMLALMAEPRVRTRRSRDGGEGPGQARHLTL
ncbi:O-antigen ligase [Sphingomonas kyeonggiensis]|uniref:O-antigen ligase family protein n=1 Tax=Sphingomonas kyeonggiensis TaxID=1268553 RepID=UPI00278045D6|nr:O-antigen ligase family protein [Sphingomonas kyeonggiensis]MDQ0250193.1 O-antigen ligase [Sphingomonas kyeonggiensis]